MPAAMRLFLSLLVATTHAYTPLPTPLRTPTTPSRCPTAAVTAPRCPPPTLQFGNLFRQLLGPTEEEDFRAADPDDFRATPAEDLEYVPLVLVIGAAGRTGRIIVRKLVLQGFRVAVLVRSLSTDTLNLLGSSVSYSYGDMTDYRTLLDAMEDVDRVIFAADGESEEVEIKGVAEVMRAFQDTRTFMYGDAEATKLSLLKMRRDVDFNRWKVDDTTADARLRLASAGIGPKPSFAYWKRSPTGAHKNGVFVGKVFDTYLGSASVSCSLSGLLVGGAPPALSAAARARLEQRELEQQQQQQLSGSGGEPAAPLIADAEADAAIDRATAAVAAKAVPLDLGEYSGLLIRCIGDGQKYTAVIRTREFAVDGTEYHADFTCKTTHFQSIRLPFSNFVAVKGGRPIPDGPELDRHSIVGLALAFYPQRNNPADTDLTGEFYLSIANIKTYRKRDEPEFVYLSDAGVAALPPLSSVAEAAEMEAAADAEASESAEGAHNAVTARRLRTKQKGEAMLRASGLTYFIARAAKLDDRPRGSRRLIFGQGADSVPPEGASLSRADIAEVAVRSLLDPRACNVACTVSESQSAAPDLLGEQDVSKALEVLEPNKF